MKDTRKEAAHHESSKFSLSKTEYGSMLIASLKFNNKNRTLSRGKKHKPKSESPLKAVGAKLMKRKVSDTSSKGIRKRYTSRKVISSKILRKALDKRSPKKLASSGPQDKYSSVISSKENESRAVTAKRSKKKSKRGHKEKTVLDVPACLQRKTRNLLIKMKHEQNYIDAYSGEGWKGQSREKIKPEKELLRAQKEILECKLGIRDTICQLDSLSKVGCIEDSVIAPDGSVSHEHIFCAKCKSNEVNLDNDIVLCDGTCNCGFHQKCLDPPLDTENIPPGDQGWYCKFCDCRMEIIEDVNARLGTQFSVSCCWQDIFKEAAVPDGGHILLNPEEEWPSDDSEDDDYDPEGRENSISGAGTGDDASGDASSSTSLGWSSDGEVFSGSRKWEMENTDFGNQSIYSSLGSDESSDGEIVYGRRQRRAVDYRKLYDLVFGEDEEFSEDEDWGPGKRKRRVKESDAASTLMTLYKSEKKSKKVETIEVKRRLSRDPQVRRSFFRIPPSAVEKLRQVFAENELPSRTVKENLSRELDVEPGKVSKWFKNARYLARKSRKADGSKELNNTSPIISTSSRLEGMKSRTGVLVEIKPTSLGNRIHSPKDLKQLLRKKNLNSVRRSLKENELKKISVESPSGSNKNVENNDDVSLKKLLISKSSRGKKMVKAVSATEYQAAEAEAEAEMERLCRAKDRLENMKKTLVGVQKHKAKRTNRKHLHQESVVYVPTAELREKF
ncbi:pathogenesis-related homeodomain protein isoform X2 [Euphorbia lathyris]|uniref:pathogenesis-related homeodomain protein isoform X2 n=1 Tax=Euphorbia lathyris TaxID=212925 RepID=UPI0033139F94